MKIQPSLTCPRCNRKTHHPFDVKDGYCGYCQWWTSDPVLGKEEIIAIAEQEGVITPLEKD